MQDHSRSLKKKSKKNKKHSKPLKQRCIDFVTQKEKKDRERAQKMKTLRKVVVDQNHDKTIIDKKRQKEFLQFLRVSNIYFLVSVVLCSIPQFSPLPGYTMISPFALVLGISLLREAYEDYKRKVNDGVTNRRICHVFDRSLAINMEQQRQTNTNTKIIKINNNNDFQNDNDNLSMQLNNLRSDFNINDNNDESAQVDQQRIKNNEEVTSDLMKEYETCFIEKQWSEIECGDILLLKDGENFPADVLILISSAENGECFVQTASLDGERALKHKQCLAPVIHTMKKQGVNQFSCQIHTQQPTKNLYEFSGFIESEQFPDFGTTSIGTESKRRSARLENKQIGLRGSNISNTEWAIGVVIFTGNDTKLMLNSGEPRFKQSRIEKTVNVICIYLIIIQAGLCLIMSIFSGYFTSQNSQYANNSSQRKAQYIYYTEINPSTDSSASDAFNSGLEAVSTYGQYYILLNTLIPISLVVSIELVKFFQTPFFSWDNEMYDEASMKHCVPMSMTLHEELAQVKYVFADKTGTLTANQMVFKACSIGSVCYDEDYKDEDYEYIEHSQDGQGYNISLRLDEESKLDDLISNTLREKEQDKKIPKPNIKKDQSETKSECSTINIIRELILEQKYFMNEIIDLGRSDPKKERVILNSQNDFLHQFLLCVAVCHDVIAVKDDKTGLRQYQGTSPDEITLLNAAKDIGYEFIDRTSNQIRIKIFEKDVTYNLLQKIEFTSDRKKMTVIIQDPETENIILYCKGADMAILERLSDQIEQPFLEATQEDLIKFCTKGFRTLCFGVRVLDKEMYDQWANKYDNSQMENIKLGHDKYKIEGAYNTENMAEKLEYEIESQLFLLGATALEDKLQDGVPEVIDDLHQAGIKVWMLTGDKLETAENIGFSSKMFNEKMFIFKLQTHSKAATRQRLQDIENKMIQIEKLHSTPIIGTQFILNPNPHEGVHRRCLNDQILGNEQNNSSNHEVRNIINALEEFKHESRHSEHTLGDSWARKPALKRKLRKRLEEIVPNKNLIAERLLRESQFVSHFQGSQHRFIPDSFDMKKKQYLINQSNIYRSSKSASKLGLVSGLDYIDNEDDFSILVEGQTLQYIMDSTKMTKKFLYILSKCKAVVVCRASPSQKGLVVKMIQDSEPGVVTLSIGDGANDVNMIQKAHIGVGIFGKEGYQAASSSDYAIGQFKFLRRLLFVHGRWNGIRLSFFMLFFFHKNLVFTLPQFWFGWYNGFSGQTFYDDNYLTVFNTIATSIAPIAFGVLDQDINPEDKDLKELINLFYPYLYKEAQITSMFSKYKFFAIFCISVAQSILVFGAPVIQMQNLMFEGGRDQDLWAASTCSYFSVVFIHYFMILPVTNNWTWSLLGLYVLSFMVFFPIFVIPYNYLPNNNIQYRLWEIVFDNGYFWLIIILIVACSIAPIKFYFWTQTSMFPSLKNLLLSKTLDVDKILKEADPTRAKLSHDMLKQKQQEQLQKWQQEYQNFEQPLRTDDRNLNNMDRSLEKLNESNLEIPDSPNHSFSRRGLSIKRMQTQQLNNSDIKDQKLVLRRLRSENQNVENQSMNRNEDDLECNIQLQFDCLSDQSEEIRYVGHPISGQVVEEVSENLDLETLSSQTPYLNTKYQKLWQNVDNDDSVEKNIFEQKMQQKNLVSSQRNRKENRIEDDDYGNALRSKSYIGKRQLTFKF